jgi:hypothetical protein
MSFLHGTLGFGTATAMSESFCVRDVVDGLVFAAARDASQRPSKPTSQHTACVFLLLLLDASVDLRRSSERCSGQTQRSDVCVRFESWLCGRGLHARGGRLIACPNSLIAYNYKSSD